MKSFETDAIEPIWRKLAAFAPLLPEDRSFLRKITTDVRHVDAREDLVCEGDAPKGVFLFLDGYACRYKVLSTGARQNMALLLPGDFCDLDVALLPRMDHSVRTLSACTVACVASHDIHASLERPALARAMRMATLVDAAITREWVLNIGLNSAVVRFAHFFCELFWRLNAVGRVTQNTFELPLTQQDLADTLGLSTVHTNRSLHTLRGARLIEMRSRHVTIPDLPRLEKWAAYRPNYLHLGNQAAA